jgi:hypothetical protein
MSPENYGGRLCSFRSALGTPGAGVHRFRVPGTNTAAADYLFTLLGAWGLAAGLRLPLVPTTVGLYLLGALCHWVFCVRVGS